MSQSYGGLNYFGETALEVKDEVKKRDEGESVYTEKVVLAPDDDGGETENERSPGSHEFARSRRRSTTRRRSTKQKKEYYDHLIQKQKKEYYHQAHDRSAVTMRYLQQTDNDRVEAALNFVQAFAPSGSADPNDSSFLKTNMAPEAAA